MGRQRVAAIYAWYSLPSLGCCLITSSVGQNVNIGTAVSDFVRETATERDNLGHL